MASIFERANNPVHIHFLHDKTLTACNRSLLCETAEIFGQRIIFYDVAHHVGHIGNDGVQLVQKTFSAGSLFRLLMPAILPLDKVLYLDSDVVVNMDIKELWDIPLEAHSLAAVRDRSFTTDCERHPVKAFKVKQMGCDWKNYVNSGVLLMNLPRIRHKFDLIQQSHLWFKRNKHLASFPDQDLINSCFRGDIKFIEEKFNFCGHAHDADINAAYIFHAMGPKPWAELRHSVKNRLYWRAFFKTAWGRLKPEEIVDLLIDIAEKSPHTHKRTTQCYRTVFYRLLRGVFYNRFIRNIIFSVKFLYHEMKYILTREKSEAI